MNAWDNETQRAMAHPIRRKNVERLLDADLSFVELLNAISDGNHGKLGYHLRALKTFVELAPSTNKYRLTDRGRLLSVCIQDFRFIISTREELTRYAQHLRLGDHAVAFYGSDYLRRKISFPFLKAGLSKGEAVVYIVAEHKLELEIREIQGYGMKVDHSLKETFGIMSNEEWFIKKGKAQAETIISNLQTLAKEKRKAGFTGARVAAEMNLLFNYNSEELLKLETALGRQFALDICGLCLYETNRLDEKRCIHVIKCHGHLISKDIVGKTIM